jgi:cyclopropane-fatty-acyl-phospholipid synthase
MFLEGGHGPGRALERKALDLALRRLRYGAVTLVDWTGARRSYGSGSPHVTVRLTDPAVLRRAVHSASLAFGEGYTDGTVAVPEEQLSDLFALVAANSDLLGPLSALRGLARRRRNHRAAQRAQIGHHYDVGNDYYRLFLDPTLTYSCAYFHTPQDTLEKAQRQKVAHVLRKLRLRPGQRLLDIGSGWGTLAVTAAKEYGVRATGVTLSTEQLAGARELAEREGVADRVDFELRNYQDLDVPAFDRVVSVGMFEHVGRHGQRTYFGALGRLLAPGGVSVLHTITDQRDEAFDAWADAHVFPGGHLPTVGEIETRLAEHGFWSVDRENLWQHYARTCGMWRANHRAHKAEIVALTDERFYREPDLWLAGSESGFARGDLGLNQFVLVRGKPDRWPLTREYLYP